MICVIYNVPWMVRCTRKVHHVVPRKLYPLACYGSPIFYPVGQVVCGCIGMIHINTHIQTGLGVALIVLADLGLLLIVGAYCPIV